VFNRAELQFDILSSARLGGFVQSHANRRLPEVYRLDPLQTQSGSLLPDRQLAMLAVRSISFDPQLPRGPHPVFDTHFDRSQN
jgi:hypothetical protein